RDLQQVVHVAGQCMAGDHLVPGGDETGEGGDGVRIVLPQLHADEGLQTEPDLLRVDLGAVAGDHPVALQPLHPAQAGRGRQVHALGEVCVGQAAVALEFVQKQQINAIQRVHACILRQKAVWLQLCNPVAPPGVYDQGPGQGIREVSAMNDVATQPRRLENLHTDKGKVPVYATGVVEQPWDTYTATDHDVWRRLYARQRELLVGRRSEAFLQAQDAMGMTLDAIPRFSDINQVLSAATGWTLIGVEGLLPELDFFDHLANRRFPVTWWIRKPGQFDYIEEPDLFHDLFGHVPLLMNPVFADYMEAYGKGGVKAHGIGADALQHLTRLYWYTV